MSTNKTSPASLCSPRSGSVPGGRAAPFRASKALTLVLFASLCGCGGGGGDSAGGQPGAGGSGGGGAQPGSPAGQLGLAVRLVASGGVDTTGQVRNRATLAVNAVIEASRLAGSQSEVLTGTLRLVGQQLEFQPTPADRLVLDLADRGVTEFFFTRITGDGSAAAQRFLSNDHDLAFRVVADGLDIDITHRRIGNQVSRTVRGLLTLAGGSAEVDVTENETIDLDVDSGANFHSVTAVGGTIDVAGVLIELSESLDTRIFVGSSTAEQFKRFQNSRWTVGGQRFELRDARIFSTFRDSRGVEFDFWRGDGTVLRDGIEAGRMESSFEGNEFVVRLVIGAESFEARRIRTD